MNLVDEVQKGAKVTVWEYKTIWGLGAWVPTGEVLTVVGVARNNQKYAIKTSDGVIWDRFGGFPNEDGVSRRELRLTCEAKERVAQEESAAALTQLMSLGEPFVRIQMVLESVSGLGLNWLRDLSQKDRDNYIALCTGFIESLDSTLPAGVFGEVPLSSHL